MTKVEIARMLPLIFCLTSITGQQAYAAKDDTTVVAFSRHTFRGISKEIGPQKISLPEYGINVEIPNLSYAYDATPRGMEIAKQYASKGLQEAAAAAVTALGSKKKFDGHWDEIQADLATERTFWTANKIRDGLRGLNKANADTVLTGCKTEQGHSIDVVSTRELAMKCAPPAVLHAALAGSPDLRKFKAQGEHFLGVVRSAIGVEGPVPSLPEPVYSEKGELPKVYAEVASLASIIEMSSALGAPLPQIFKNVPKGPLLKKGKEAIAAGVNFLGVRFFIGNPTPVADAITMFPAKFISTQAKGRHTLVLAHDDFIAAMMHGLGILSTAGDVNDLGIYPIETFVVAYNDSKASVARMQLKVKNDGSIPGPFEHKVVWTGTRAQWDEKVKAANDRAQAWNIGKEGQECLAALKMCKAEPVEVAY
jgi:hypothetical protein